MCFAGTGLGQDAGSLQADTVAARYKHAIGYVIPVQFTENGPGAGIGYEKRLGLKPAIGLCLTGMATFDVANTNKIYNYNTGNYNTGSANAMFYAMPAVMLYPFGAHAKFSYACGVAAVVGIGKKSSDYYTVRGTNLAERIQTHFVTGGLVQNSLSIYCTPAISIKLELGLGSSFINKLDGVRQSNQLLAQGGVKLGFRL